MKPNAIRSLWGKQIASWALLISTYLPLKMPKVATGIYTQTLLAYNMFAKSDKA
jgi:hypothetical protein